MIEWWTILVLAFCAALAVTLTIFIPSIILWAIYKFTKLLYDYFITGNIDDHS